MKGTLQTLHGWYNNLLALPSELLGPYAVVCVSTTELVSLVLPKLQSMQDQIQLDIIKKAKTMIVSILTVIKEKSEVHVIIHKCCICLNVRSGCVVKKCYSHNNNNYSMLKKN